uniref:Conserved hypothetical plastid protein n=1 Tax=Mastocarpus papillatus TaxID=31436 RepID=A0A342RZM8_9FLOR|nr:conserved hypothetical plastid protein [Mastocarpus papillatus]AOL58174.1 conserved hypothetical plastid protein [Mastocarpus papillatus]
MFINLLQITFLNTYIISPKTWIHKIQNYKKISFIFIFLSFIPYINYQYIIIFTLISIFIAISYKKKCREYLKNILNALLVVSIIYMCFNDINVNNGLCRKNSVHIPFYITLLNLLIQIIRQFFTINNLNQYNYMFTIPKFILRAFIITILYSLCIKILFSTTTYEDIVLHYLTKCISSNNIFIQKINLITILSCQFLVLFTNRINIITTAIKVRNTNNIFSIYHYNLYYYALKNLLRHVRYDAQLIIFILYSREIKCKNLIMKEIYGAS